MPGHEITIRIILASVVFTAFFRLTDDNLLAALRAFNADFFQIWFGVFTVRKTGTSQEFSVGTIFDNKVSAAKFTDFFRNFIRNFDSIKFCIRFLHSFRKIRVKVLNNGLPRYISVSDAVQKIFHVSGKRSVYNRREGLHHHSVDDLSKLRDIQVLVFLCNIAPRNNSRYGRGVSTRPSYPLLFQGLYKRCLRVMGRRLRKMLAAVEFDEIQCHPLLQLFRQNVILLFLILLNIN